MGNTLILSSPSYHAFRPSKSSSKQIFTYDIIEDDDFLVVEKNENYKFSLLNRDELLNILSFLDSTFLICTMSFVCKKWQMIASMDELWKPRFANQFPMSDTKSITSFGSWKKAFINEYKTQKLRWRLVKNSCRFVKNGQGAEFKVLLLGDVGVGKTCLVKHIMDPNFFATGFCTEPSNTVPATFGMDIKDLYVRVGDLRHYQHVKLQIWDSSGLHRWRKTTQASVSCDGFMLAFDLSDKESFFGVEQWRQTIEDKKGCPMMLIGLKSDAERKVARDEALKYAEKHEMAYLEVSTKARKKCELPFYFFAMLATKKIRLSNVKKFVECPL